MEEVTLEQHLEVFVLELVVSISPQDLDLPQGHTIIMHQETEDLQEHLLQDLHSQEGLEGLTMPLVLQDLLHQILLITVTLIILHLITDSALHPVPLLLETLSHKEEMNISFPLRKDINTILI